MKNQHKRNAWISTAVLLAAAGAAHAGDRAASQSEQAAQQGERFSIAIERVRPDRVVPQRQAIAIERVRPVRVADVLVTTAIAYTLDAAPSNDDPKPAPANRGLPFDRALLVPTGSRWADEQETQKISQPLTAATSGTNISSAIPMQPVGSMTTPVVVTTTTSTPQPETMRTEKVAVVDTASKDCSSVYASTSAGTAGHVCDAVETPEVFASVTGSSTGEGVSQAIGQMVAIPMQPVGVVTPVEATQVRTTPVIRIASELLPPLDSHRPISSPQGWNLVATPLPTAEAVAVTAQPEVAAPTMAATPLTETFVATPAPAPAPAVTTITSPTSVASTSPALATPGQATPGQMVRVVTESELAESVQPDVATKLFAQAVPAQPIAAPAMNEAASGVTAEVAELFAGELSEPVRESVVASGIRQMTAVTTDDLMPKLEEVEWFVAHHSAQAKAGQTEVSQAETVVAEATSPAVTAPATQVPFITAAETFEAPAIGTIQQMTVVSASPADATEPTIFAQAEPVEEVMIATTPLETPAVETASVNAVETTIQTPTMTIVGTMEPVDTGRASQATSTPAVVTTTPSAMSVRTSVRSSEEARTDAVLATLRRQAVSEDIFEEAQRRLLVRREVSATPRMSEMTLIVGDTLGRQIARSAGYLE